MAERSRWLVGAALAAVALAVVPVRAQDGAAGYAAHVHAGSCDLAGTDQIVASLGDLFVPAGDALGPPDAVVAERSYTVIPVALADLLAAPHAIDVLSDGAGAVACGAIGGPLDANGALVIARLPADGSGVSGIAYLAPSVVDPAQTGVSVFVAESGGDRGSEDEAPIATETAIVTVDGPVPTEHVTATPADDQEYATTVRRQVALLVASIVRVDALFDEPRIGEEACTNQLAAELTLWQILYDDVRQTTPPAGFAAFHAGYLEALALLDGAAADVFVALDTGDRARLAKGADKIERAI